jgi:hypothetical protein
LLPVAPTGLGLRRLPSACVGLRRLAMARHDFGSPRFACYRENRLVSDTFRLDAVCLMMALA